MLPLKAALFSLAFCTCFISVWTTPTESTTESFTTEEPTDIPPKIQKIWPWSKPNEETVKDPTPVKVSSFPCQCVNLDCSCCGTVRSAYLNVDHTACGKLTLLTKQLGLRLSASHNNKTYLVTTFFGRNPPPLCFSIPFTLTSYCAHLYDVYFLSPLNAHACFYMESRYDNETTNKIDFNCLEFGTSGLQRVSPTPVTGEGGAANAVTPSENTITSPEPMDFGMSEMNSNAGSEVPPQTTEGPHAFEDTSSHTISGSYNGNIIPGQVSQISPNGSTFNLIFSEGGDATKVHEFFPSTIPYDEFVLPYPTSTTEPPVKLDLSNDNDKFVVVQEIIINIPIVRPSQKLANVSVIEDTTQTDTESPELTEGNASTVTEVP